MWDMVTKTANPHSTQAKPVLRLAKLEDQQDAEIIDDFPEVDRKYVERNAGKAVNAQVTCGSCNQTFNPYSADDVKAHLHRFEMESPEEIKKILQSEGCFQVQQLVDRLHRTSEMYLKDQLPEGVESWEKVWNHRVELDKELKRLKKENERLEHELAEHKAGLESKYQTSIDNLTKVAEGQKRTIEVRDTEIKRLHSDLFQAQSQYHVTQGKLDRLMTDLDSQLRIIEGDRSTAALCAGREAVNSMKLKTDIEPWINKDNKSKTAEDYAQTSMYYSGRASAGEYIHKQVTAILDKAKKS